jgi:hypothetical protein
MISLEDPGLRISLIGIITIVICAIIVLRIEYKNNKE